jgi:CheY-like chemotaxis protein
MKTVLILLIAFLTVVATRSEQVALTLGIAPGAVLAGIRVLAVDDNADAREVLQASLSESGAIVQVASSGQEVLRLLEHEQFDVLICDLAMPQMDGFELLTRIRRGDTAQSPSLPAIALTAHAFERDRAFAVLPVELPCNAQVERVRTLVIGAEPIGFPPRACARLNRIGERRIDPVLVVGNRRGSGPG